jgi:hypothetical protein
MCTFVIGFVSVTASRRAARIGFVRGTPVGFPVRSHNGRGDELRAFLLTECAQS